MSVCITQVGESDRSFTMVAEQDVAVTVEEFDRAIGRPREMGEWFGVEFTWPTCPNHQMEVGSALEFRAPIGPLHFDFIMIVADRVPGESLLFRTTRGSVDVTLEYTWWATSTGTRVRLNLDFRLRHELWWRTRWTQAVARRKLTVGMERMRQQLGAAPCAQTAAPVVAGSGAEASRETGAPGRGRMAAAHRAAHARHRAQRA